MYHVIVTEADEEEYEALGEKLIEESIARGAPDYLPDNKYFQIYVDDKLVGEAITTELRGSVELDLIFVEMEYRKRGIGKALLESVENYAKNIGAAGVKIWTSSWEDAEFYNQFEYNEVVKIPLKTNGCFEGQQQFEQLFYKAF